MCEEAQQHHQREENLTFLIGEDTNSEEGVVSQSLPPMDVHCAAAGDPTRAELNNPMNEVIDTIYTDEGADDPSSIDPTSSNSNSNSVMSSEPKTHTSPSLSIATSSTTNTTTQSQPPPQLQSPLLNPPVTPVTPGAAAPPPVPPPKIDRFCVKHPNIEVTLDGKELWDKFYQKGTEMIVNRSGRRMFPGFSVSITGLRPKSKYSMKLDVVLADNHRFKFLNARWLAVGSSEPQNPFETYLHPDSPNTGSFWMRHGVSFRKLKITNNKDKPGQNALLHSMHKYFVRLLIDEERKPGPNEGKGYSRPIIAVEFPETTFIAVTAYQNEEVTQLKISNNPFAKAFRENTTDMDWETAQALYNPQGYMPGQSGSYYSSAWGMQSPLLSPSPLTPTIQHHTYQPPQHFTPHHQIQLHHQPSLAAAAAATPQGMQYSPDSPMLGKVHQSGSGFFQWPPQSIKSEPSSSSPCYQQPPPPAAIYGAGAVSTSRHSEGSPSVYHHVQYSTAPPSQQLPDFDSVFTSPPPTGSMHNVYNEPS